MSRNKEIKEVLSKLVGIVSANARHNHLNGNTRDSPCSWLLIHHKGVTTEVDFYNHSKLAYRIRRIEEDKKHSHSLTTDKLFLSNGLFIKAPAEDHAVLKLIAEAIVDKLHPLTDPGTKDTAVWVSREVFDSMPYGTILNQRSGYIYRPHGVNLN